MPIFNGRILDRIRSLPISRTPPYRLPVELENKKPVKIGTHTVDGVVTPIYGTPRTLKPCSTPTGPITMIPSSSDTGKKPVDIPDYHNDSSGRTLVLHV